MAYCMQKCGTEAEHVKENMYLNDYVVKKKFVF